MADPLSEAELAIRQACQALLALAADDSSYYTLLQDLAKIGAELVKRQRQMAANRVAMQPAEAPPQAG
jgi:hypothetical protein